MCRGVCVPSCGWQERDRKGGPPLGENQSLAVCNDANSDLISAEYGWFGMEVPRRTDQHRNPVIPQMHTQSCALHLARAYWLAGSEGLMRGTSNLRHFVSRCYRLPLDAEPTISHTSGHHSQGTTTKLGRLGLSWAPPTVPMNKEGEDSYKFRLGERNRRWKDGMMARLLSLSLACGRERAHCQVADV